MVYLIQCTVWCVVGVGWVWGQQQVLCCLAQVWHVSVWAQEGFRRVGLWVGISSAVGTCCRRPPPTALGVCCS